ncbi:hypothetical protein [Nonomuraea soli]|uniref:Exo-alpha-sialidase n=1 Tax=Nonomuraea soli TaxID=1032476 RepID=A0A7W0CUN1_9ACTN|nr:hypothetical protein [Nonomuraea soli]MBA2897464.1 hypothetical protein [Nonomuraea soli]
MKLLLILALLSQNTPAAGQEAEWGVVRTARSDVLGGYQDVGASRRDDAWVVRTGRPLLRWDGRAWHNAGGTAVPYLVRAHGPDEIWRFNESVEQVEVWRWNGRTWTALPIRESGAHATAALVPRKGECWAAGLRFGDHGMEDMLWHWTGKSWTSRRAPMPITDFAAASTTGLWALSSYEGGPSASILRWTGREWRRVALPRLPYAELNDIVALAPDDVWAVGSLVSSKEGLVLHWDGVSWKHSAHRPAGTDFRRAAPDGAGGLWLAARKRQGPDSMTHYVASSTWQEVPLDLPEAEITGLANVPGTTMMWATVDARGEQVILSYK